MDPVWINLVFRNDVALHPNGHCSSCVTAWMGGGEYGMGCVCNIYPCHFWFLVFGQRSVCRRIFTNVVLFTEHNSSSSNPKTQSVNCNIALLSHIPPFTVVLERILPMLSWKGSLMLVRALQWTAMWVSGARQILFWVCVVCKWSERWTFSNPVWLNPLPGEQNLNLVALRNGNAGLL